MLKISEWGLEEFQTFCQTLNEANDDWDVTPKRSIFRSPFMSMGMGCARPETGADMVLRSWEFQLSE